MATTIDDIHFHTCSRCGKIDSNTTMKKCSRCLAAYYCGVDCQKVDWPLHKGICKKKKAATPTVVPTVVYDEPSPQNLQLLDAVIRYAEAGPGAGRDGEKRIAALLKVGANPTYVGSKSAPLSGRCALHVACYATATHPAAFTTKLLSMLGQSQVPLDWTRFSDVSVSPAAAATALGACLVASRPNPAAARWVFLMAGQASSESAVGAATPDPAAHILAGARLLQGAPCWVEYPHSGRNIPDVRLPIHNAAVSWDLSTLSTLLEAGSDVHALTSWGFSGEVA